MRKHASGPFDVKMVPQPPDDGGIGRMILDKRYHGDLDATAHGTMLAIRTAIDDSAGYVAMEIVTGTLHGRNGSFALQHSGSMDRGAQQLSIAVVADSGTGELAGLTGTMTIDIDGGKHAYRFDYTL